MLSVPVLQGVLVGLRGGHFSRMIRRLNTTPDCCILSRGARTHGGDRKGPVLDHPADHARGIGHRLTQRGGGGSPRFGLLLSRGPAHQHPVTTASSQEAPDTRICGLAGGSASLWSGPTNELKRGLSSRTIRDTLAT